jgi:Brp/Blh family beta-carotene 15,15'-monooxygenase
MTASPHWQTWLFACAVLITITANLVFQPNMTVQLLMLVPAVAVLGLPHGALDLSIAQSLWPLKGWRGHVRFAGLYLGLALLVIGVWIVFPGPALCAFLIYSAVHFSGDWDHSAITVRWIGGIAAVGAPALFHREEVATIFSYLAPEQAAEFAALFLAFSGAAALALYIILLMFQPRLRTSAALEQGMIWIAAAFLAPLVYFIIYFCTLHSVRHFSDAFVFLDHKRHALRVAGLLCVMTILAGFFGFAIMQSFETFDVEKSILQIIFIGLAALTVPHMILVERFQHQIIKRRSKEKSDF